MSDYAAYRRSVNISNGDIIRVLSPVYPHFSKVQTTMINNSDKYGVRLTKEAEQLLAEEFGYGVGLEVKPKKKRSVKRAKSHHLSVRLDDQCYDMVREKMRQKGCTSVQSFLEEMLKGET